MKFKFEGRNNSHKNDCWCDAIALATKQEYNKVYKMFKPFIEKNGELNSMYIKTYLESKGYTHFENDTSLFQALQVFDKSNGVVYSTEHEDGGHVIFVKDNFIYDNVEHIEIIEWVKNQKCTDIFIKIEDTYSNVFE